MKIYNSLTRAKETFVPLVPQKIGMYVCGPTVYDEPHIGHARSAYNFDVVRRYLIYRGYDVTFVRNVTDVDDKIIDKARKEFAGEDLNAAAAKVAEKYLASYRRYMDALGIMPPTHEPKATGYIPKMQTFIARLIERGAAYPSGGDVYFDIRKAKGYGKLSNQSLEKMHLGARIAPGEKKRDGLDFALWKAAKEGEPSWESPWGRGRPGWHIECSVMSSDILGETFDIHGGGIDLIFPHHENEVAQSEGAGHRFARYWIHNGLLTIDSEKMAKSLGNFITIDDFLRKYGDGDYLKLFFLSSHYRSPVDFTAAKIAEAKKEKERFILFSEKAERMRTTAASGSGLPAQEGAGAKEIDRFRRSFEEAMDDDCNTPAALAVLFDLVTYGNKVMHGKDTLTGADADAVAAAKDLLTGLTGVFGLSLQPQPGAGAGDDAAIAALVDERNRARAAKDFKRSDDIRRALTERGVILEDTKDRTLWRRKL